MSLKSSLILPNRPKSICRRKQRTFQCHGLKADVENRTIKGYASTFIKDSVGDIVVPGAFEKTIKERGPQTVQPGGIRSKIKVGYNHGEIIGLPLLMREDDKGLYTESRVDPTVTGTDVLIKVESGTLDAMSFAYDIIQWSYNEETNELYLEELKVWEYGPVDFPCNETANIIGMKDLLSHCGDPDELAYILAALRSGKTIDQSIIEKLQSTVEFLTTIITGGSGKGEEGSTDSESREKGEAAEQETETTEVVEVIETIEHNDGLSEEDRKFLSGFDLKSLQIVPEDWEVKTGSDGYESLAGPLNEWNSMITKSIAALSGGVEEKG